MCLMFILSKCGRKEARESEGFEMAVKVSMEIWPRGNGDLYLEMGIEMGIKREQQIRKNGERERESVCNGLVERNKKKIEKIYYLNK